MSPRLAGNEPGYQFQVIDRNTGAQTDWGFNLDSVTSILSATLGKPAGAMTWWGYRVGLKGVMEALDQDPGTALEASTPEELEAVLKGRGVSPNMSLDSASSRGHAAHEIMEHLACGRDEQARILIAAEIEGPGTHYGEAVLAHWTEQVQPLIDSGKIIQVVAERPVWSLRYGYAGTLDLALQWEDGTWTIADGKSHKPASGFTKPGQGPAYISDAIQIGAYRTAWEEMGLGKTIGSQTIVWRDTGKYLTDEREVDPAIFLHLLEVYRLKQPFERGQA